MRKNFYDVEESERFYKLIEELKRTRLYPEYETFLNKCITEGKLKPENALEKEIMNNTIDEFIRQNKELFDKIIDYEMKRKGRDNYNQDNYNLEIYYIKHNWLKSSYLEYVHRILKGNFDHERDWRRNRYQHLVWYYNNMQDDCEVYSYNNDLKEFLERFIDCLKLCKERNDKVEANVIANEIPMYYKKILVDNERREDVDYSNDEKVIDDYLQHINREDINFDELISTATIFSIWFCKQTQIDESW